MNQYFEEQESLVPTIMANFTCFTGNCTSDVLPTITSTVIPEAPAPHYNTLQVLIIYCGITEATRAEGRIFFLGNCTKWEVFIILLKRLLSAF